MRIVGVGLLCAVSSTCCAGILNGGFESGVLHPWTSIQGPDPGDPWSISQHARTGLFGASVEANQSIVQTIDPVRCDQVATFSLWLRNSDMQESGMNIRYSDGSVNGIVLRLDSTDWTFFDLSGELDRSKELVQIQIYGHAQSPRPNRTDLDDVSLVLVPEPVTMASLALGVFLALRRRHPR